MLYYPFLKPLSDLHFVEAIWLFGSRARNDQQETSDIDIAIVCPKATSDDWQQIVDIIENTNTLLEIDCVRWDTLREDDPLRAQILRDKRVLFDRSQPMNSLATTLQQLENALLRLDEVLQVPETETTYVKDAAIQRFEFCIELYWKVLKKICEQEGFEVNSPRVTLQKAFAMKLIHPETLWLSMLNDRNLTSHTYLENLADEIYHRLKTYLPAMNETLKRLQPYVK